MRPRLLSGPTLGQAPPELLEALPAARPRPPYPNRGQADFVCVPETGARRSATMPTKANPTPHHRALLVLVAAVLAAAVGFAGGASPGAHRVVAFGDSTTAPREVEGKALPVYADLLAAEAKPWGVQFINAGIAGNTTADARKRFRRDVLDPEPELVILQFGINDAAVDVWRKPPAREPRVSLKDYAANLSYFVSELRGLGARVMLMTPNPLRWTNRLRALYGQPPYAAENPNGLNVRLKTYARAAGDVARQCGAELVDVYAAFEAYGAEPGRAVDDLLLDGMHPNREGHQLIADLLRQQLETTAHKPAATGRFKPTPSGIEIDFRATDMPGQKMGPFVRLSDGRLLTVDTTNCLTSADEGRTWQAKTIFTNPTKFRASNERVLLRTREGVLITAFMNLAERSWTWDKQLGDAPGAALPTYVMRSTDEGKTWEPPIKLHADWTGAEREILQTRSGRVIFTSMKMRHNPGRHTVLTYGSDDQGRTWQPSNVIDLGGAGNHDGVTEATIVELKDGRLLKYMRTNWGRFWVAESADEGLTWHPLGPGDIPASAAPGLLRRLQSGRIVLVWNQQFPEGKDSFTLSGGDRDWSFTPASVFRGELSIAFSDDECRTWTRPVVIARKPGPRVWLAYPFLFEAAPGELWVTTMQGGVRLKLRESDFVLEQR